MKPSYFSLSFKVTLSYRFVFFLKKKKKKYLLTFSLGFPGGSGGKESACNEGDPGLILGSGRSPGGGHGNHSGILAWEIPWTEEPGGLCSPRGCREYDMTEWLTHTHSHTHIRTMYFPHCYSTEYPLSLPKGRLWTSSWALRLYIWSLSLFATRGFHSDK